MARKSTIGMRDTNIDPNKLATCPYFSTTNCPSRFDRVAPKPKQLAVKPTVVIEVVMKSCVSCLCIDQNEPRDKFSTY